MPSTLDAILFFTIAALAIVSAAGLLFSKNAVHAAVLLVANFATVAVFFLLLNAPFVAMVQVTVYAGAIMVLFLFVIMLLGAERLNDDSRRLPGQEYLALALCIILAAVPAILLTITGQNPTETAPPLADPAGFGSPAEIGRLMFTDYTLPFEITSFLLLIGMIGAVVLTRDAFAGGKVKPVAGSLTAPTENPEE
jgi:NADH-quinone oxidoreductase subunit J